MYRYLLSSPKEYNLLPQGPTASITAAGSSLPCRHVTLLLLPGNVIGSRHGNGDIDIIDINQLPPGLRHHGHLQFGQLLGLSLLHHLPLGGTPGLLGLGAEADLGGLGPADGLHGVPPHAGYEGDEEGGRAEIAHLLLRREGLDGLGARDASVGGRHDAFLGQLVGILGRKLPLGRCLTWRRGLLVWGGGTSLGIAAPWPAGALSWPARFEGGRGGVICRRLRLLLAALLLHRRPTGGGATQQ
mmetsp:Transcript_29152/g.84751  ORF Transcript_29152/g.84751 Transcript_29152/m.84751 type:complete len:243 (+) Transcript_29152:928-1656(+)